jgi:enoyl-CoA hydratase/carnithine racemase
MSDLIEVREDGAITTVRLLPTSDIRAANLKQRDELLRALYDARLARQKVLILEIPEEELSPRMVEGLWEEGRERLGDQPRFAKEEDLPLLLRVRSAYEKIIEYTRQTNVVLIASFCGEVDFDLLGVVLAADYRICSDDARLVNNVLDRGVTPGGGLVWYLTRSVGNAQAMELLLEGRSLDATEARSLGLVSRVVPAADLARETRRFADHLAEKPAEALSSLTRAHAAADETLDKYLEKIGVGFEKIPR